jgi:hypothetical protein
MIGLFFLRLYRQSLAVGCILSLAWWVTGAAPYATTAPGLMKSAPQFTVNQFRKGDRLGLQFAILSQVGGARQNSVSERTREKLAALARRAPNLLDPPMSRTPAVQHGARRLIEGDYPFAAIGWQRSLAAAAPSLSKLDADDQGAFSRGCAACQTGADLDGSVSQAARSAARG